MPNWVKNIIHMEGIAREPIFVEEDGGKHFEFDKLIPMPESLKVDSGSMTDENIVYYLTERCTIPVRKLPPDKEALMKTLVKNTFAGEKWPEEVFHRVMAQAFEESDDRRQKRYDTGKTYISNYQLYGATTWYDWCCQNWGTKWSACHTVIIDEDTIEFDTAWSNPEPILLKLAEMYPDRKIEHWWADENVGYNTGHRCLQGKTVTEEFPEAESDEAMAIFAKCWES